jgi:ubiquinone/menaquinone biosynthesis C-methylase UbiE
MSAQLAPGTTQTEKGIGMNTKASIANAYDRAADEYAAKWWNEFAAKHFDRIMLSWYATQIPQGETVLEIGAGPGEVSGFLNHLGAKCLGTDLSEQMIENARKYFPDIQFEVQDFFHLTYQPDSFYGVVAYYAIVNWPLDEIKGALEEVKRVLKSGGLFLFTFHIHEGEDRTDVPNFFVKDGTELTFYYFKVDDMKALVESLGFQIVDILVRYPYKDVEYPSKRSYFLVRKA